MPMLTSHVRRIANCFVLFFWFRGDSERSAVSHVRSLDALCPKANPV